MPRPRKRNHDLPQGVYLHGRRYRMRIVTKDGSAWHDLGTDKAKAIAQWRKMMGQPADRISALMDRYIEEELCVGAKAPKTIKEQKRQMETLRQVFGSMAPSDLEPMHAIAYIDKRGEVAPIAANREIALMRHLLTKCLHWGELRSNPFGLSQFFKLPLHFRTHANGD